MKMKTTIQNLWNVAKGVKRDVYSNIGLYQKGRKISSKQPNLTSKGDRKRTTNKT